MKIIIIVSIFLFFLPFAGCQKDTVAPEITVTEDDAADVIGIALASNSRGMISQFGIGSEIIDSGKFPAFHKAAIVPIETTVTRQGSFGGYSYQYTARYRYEFSLLNDSLNFQYWLKGAYSTPRISADDSAWSDMKITRLGNDSCRINGTYNRIGSHALKIRDQKQFHISVTAVLSNIIYNQTEQRAVYGSMTLMVSGESSTGTAFAYSGVLSVYGNLPASLILEDRLYEVDLSTGIATFIPDDDDGDDDDDGL